MFRPCHLVQAVTNEKQGSDDANDRRNAINGSSRIQVRKVVNFVSLISVALWYPSDSKIQPTEETISCGGVNPLQVFPDPFGIKPSNFVECRPKLAGLIDINLASLLSIGLPELFVDSQRINSLDEDSPLRCEIGSAIETKISGKQDLIGVE